jgi:NADPH-dependent ferric siderophore reductase
VAGRPVQTFEVVRTEQLTPHLIRVVLGGSGFDTFTPNNYTDAYVKIVFVSDGIDVGALPQPLTLDSFKTLPVEQQPPVRTYTIRRVDPEFREISIDFVVHGDHGVAGPWAAAAEPGQSAYLMGPSGAYAPDPAADWHLLAGDEAAVPAISAALEALPDNAIGKVFIEVAGPDDEIPLKKPDGVEVRWIYRGRADLVREDQSGDHSPLIAAVKEAHWLPGQVQVFIHGEAQTVMHNLRPFIRKERGVDAKWAASISGYWRRGRSEETFREWKRELAEAESGTGA